MRRAQSTHDPVAGRTLRRSMIGLTAIAALLLTTATFAVERPIRFKRLSLDEGLSQSTVLSVHQDSAGYVWVGTEDGLNRYDGLGFSVFKHDASDPASIPGNFVWAIEEDAEGNLWVATEDGGVGRFERASGSFTRLDTVTDRTIRALHVDDDGTLWLGTRDAGVRRIAAGSLAVTSYRVDGAGLADDHVYVLHRDRSGELWVGTDAGLQRFDSTSGSFVAVEAELSGPRIRAITDDSTGRLWIGTYKNGLNRLDPATGAVEQFRHDPENAGSVSHDRIRSLFEDRQGRLWVGTSNGLDLYDAQRNRFSRYAHDPADPHSLGDDHVMVISQDRAGVLWVGTRFGGVHAWHPRGWQFGHMRTVAAAAGDPASSRVSSFTEDTSGRLWIGTFGGGLQLLDERRESVTTFRHDPEDFSSLSSDRVTALAQDHHGRVWVGTLDAGLNVLDVKTGDFRRFPHDPQHEGGIAAPGITSIVQDRTGGLWIGTYGGGVDRLRRDEESFLNYRHDPQNDRTLANDRVTSLAESPRGRIWVGTHGGGIALLDPRTGRATRFRHDDGTASSLSSDHVYSLLVDAKGGLWVGTGGGLNHLPFDKIESGEFRRFGQRDGLPNEFINGIEEDLSGRLWISTNRGLSCFDPREGSFRNYDARDGLQGNEFNFGAAFRASSGEMFFGGINGFNAFDPQQIRGNDLPPPIVLTSVARSRQELDAPADQVSEVSLSYRDRVISFEFAALDFTDPGRNQFAYRLDGFDDAWVEAGSDNRVTYTNLDPGRYTLRVRAANSDGVWNEEGLAVELGVQAPPWRSPLAYSGYTVGLLSCLFGFVHVQRRKVAREAEYSRLLEEQVKHRTLELTRRTSELEQVNHRLVKASITDSLTGFANRRFLMEYLEKEIALVQRRYSAVNDGTLQREAFDLAFMMIDLDEFKSINDTFGHAAGDEVLRQLRTILDDACRQSDIVIRWGGDEFLVVARDLDIRNLADLAERVRARIEKHPFTVAEGQVVRTTCSIGYACYPFVASDLDAISWEQVIAVADRALYVSKHSGRNAWVGFESTETTQVDSLLAEIRHGAERLVAEGQLQIHTSLDGHARTVEWTLED